MFDNKHEPPVDPNECGDAAAPPVLQVKSSPSERVPVVFIVSAATDRVLTEVTNPMMTSPVLNPPGDGATAPPNFADQNMRMAIQAASFADVGIVADRKGSPPSAQASPGHLSPPAQIISPQLDSAGPTYHTPEVRFPMLARCRSEYISSSLFSFLPLQPSTSSSLQTSHQIKSNLCCTNSKVH